VLRQDCSENIERHSWSNPGQTTVISGGSAGRLANAGGSGPASWEDEMSWRDRNRMLVTLALAAALLAAPAGAAARQHGGKAIVADPSELLSQVVAWLQSLTAPTIDPDGARTNSGSSIDPNGATTDEGSSIDPNGVK
jgi:hypothetical protein